MKKIAVLGTGSVGATLGTRLIQLGYQVKMGSRSATNEKAAEWVNANGANASAGTFADAAAFGDIILNCTKGDASIEVMKAAGADNLRGKILIDISNPLDFSKGMPPSLLPDYSNTWSMGEAIQQLLPDTKVVKTLNTVNCLVMVDAARSGGDPTMFMSGNDAGAKEEVKNLLNQFGWKDVLDLGDISSARTTEMLVPLWVRAWMATGNGNIAFKLVR